MTEKVSHGEGGACGPVLGRIIAPPPSRVTRPGAPAPGVLSVGTELTFVMQGLVEGSTSSERTQNPCQDVVAMPT